VLRASFNNQLKIALYGFCRAFSDCLHCSYFTLFFRILYRVSISSLSILLIRKSCVVWSKPVNILNSSLISRLVLTGITTLISEELYGYKRSSTFCPLADSFRSDKLSQRTPLSVTSQLLSRSCVLMSFARKWQPKATHLRANCNVLSPCLPGKLPEVFALSSLSHMSSKEGSIAAFLNLWSAMMKQAVRKQT
jgi:hypothetical protein